MRFACVGRAFGTFNTRDYQGINLISCPTEDRQLTTQIRTFKHIRDDGENRRLAQYPGSDSDDIEVLSYEARIDHICKSGVAGDCIFVIQPDLALEVSYQADIAIGRTVNAYRCMADIGGLIVPAHDPRCRSRDFPVLQTEVVIAVAIGPSDRADSSVDVQFLESGLQQVDQVCVAGIGLHPSCASGNGERYIQYPGAVDHGRTAR